jgi:hypothetical protein
MRRTVLSHTLITCGLVVFLSAAARGQARPTIPTPVDRATAEMRIEPAHVSADGSEFLLLVRLRGGMVLKYLAQRQDLVDQINQLVSDLDAENANAEAAADGLIATAASRQEDVNQLLSMKNMLLEGLATSDRNEARLRRRAGGAGAGGDAAGGDVAAGPPATPLSTSLTARYKYTGPKTVEEFVAEDDPNTAVLLSLPINFDALRFNFDETRPDEPDGTRLMLAADVGGVSLKFVASREDYARFVRDQVDRRLYLKNQLALLTTNRNTQIQLLEEKRDILTADVSDLSRALQLSRENIETLETILKTQKRSSWERLIEAVPSIAGIIALAIAK